MITLLVGTDEVVIDGRNVICNNAELKRDIDEHNIGDIPSWDMHYWLVQSVIDEFGGTIVGDDPAYAGMTKTRRLSPTEPRLVY